MLTFFYPHETDVSSLSAEPRESKVRSASAERGGRSSPRLEELNETERKRLCRNFRFDTAAQSVSCFIRVCESV